MPKIATGAVATIPTTEGHLRTVKEVENAHPGHRCSTNSGRCAVIGLLNHCGKHFFEEPVVGHNDPMKFYDLDAVDRLAELPLADEHFPDLMPESYADKFLRRASGTARALREGGVLKRPAKIKWKNGEWIYPYAPYAKQDLLKVRRCLENVEELCKTGFADPVDGHFWVIQRTSPLIQKGPKKYKKKGKSSAARAPGGTVAQNKRRKPNKSKVMYSIVDLGAGEFAGRGRIFTRSGAEKRYKIPHGRRKRPFSGASA